MKITIILVIVVLLVILIGVGLYLRNLAQKSPSIIDNEYKQNMEDAL